nr:hypothetical protein HAGR004_03380 [Bdellovibrio sp. HAGR004]
MKRKNVTSQKKRKVRDFDHLNAWRSVYQLAALVEIDHNASLIGRERVPYTTLIARNIDNRFSYSRISEENLQMKLIANDLVDILAEMYRFSIEGQLDEESVLYLFLQVVYFDNSSILGRRLSAHNIGQTKWKRIQISSRQIHDLEGPKKAAQRLVGEVLGISESTIKNMAGTESIPLVLGEPPTSKKDLALFDRSLAISLLTNAFHLDKDAVESAVNELFKGVGPE